MNQQLVVRESFNDEEEHEMTRTRIEFGVWQVDS